MLLKRQGVQPWPELVFILASLVPNVAVNSTWS